MRFSTKCWSEHILSAYKATKDLKHPLYMTFIFLLWITVFSLRKIIYVILSNIQDLDDTA